MGKFAATLASVLFLAGCGPSNVFHGDLAFSTEERQAIEQAAQEMSARTGGEPIEIRWDGGIDDGEQRIVRQQSPRDPNAEGELYQSSSTYARSMYLRPGVPVHRLRIVAMHEWGHWYGMSHLAPPKHGLMSTVASEGGWSPDDAAECRRVRLCD